MVCARRPLMSKGEKNWTAFEGHDNRVLSLRLTFYCFFSDLRSTDSFVLKSEANYGRVYLYEWKFGIGCTTVISPSVSSLTGPCQIIARTKSAYSAVLSDRDDLSVYDYPWCNQITHNLLYMLLICHIQRGVPDRTYHHGF